MLLTLPIAIVARAVCSACLLESINVNQILETNANHAHAMTPYSAIVRNMVTDFESFTRPGGR